MRALFVLACVGLVACSADAESGAPALVGSSDVGAPAAAPAGSSPTQAHSDGHAKVFDGDVTAPATTTTREPSSSGFVCRPGAFCEDFEEQGYEARWKATVTTGGAFTLLDTDSASLGRGSLRAVTSDEDSSAYLLLEKGRVPGTDWSGVLGFAFRVGEVPSSVLGGPALTVTTPDGPVTIRVMMSSDSVFLQQSGAPGCAADRCVETRTRIAAAHPHEWYRVRLGFEVNPSRVAPYGRIEAAVDDSGDVVSMPLSVPLFDGPVSLAAGITQSDPGRRTVADLDDVTLLVR